jgi:PIN domain nuclease of toxin-antitoxin system
MNLLLDTHILLWWLANDEKLPSRAGELLADPSQMIFVSAASLWETAIKIGAKKLKVDLDEFEQGIVHSGFQILPVTARHALATARLPRHHADPFDRMLIAQAQVEPLRLLTHDAVLTRYGESVMLV